MSNRNEQRASGLPDPDLPNPDLADSFNAEPWADSFIKTFRNNPNRAMDEGILLAWFSAAIMAGYDRGARDHSSFYSLTRRVKRWLNL